MPPSRSLSFPVLAALLGGLSSCRSSPKAALPSSPPVTVAPKAAENAVPLAPWAPPSRVPTSDRPSAIIPSIPTGPSIPVSPSIPATDGSGAKPAAPPPESTELRPCVPAPALPGSPSYWLPAGPVVPVSPATSPAVPAGPLSPPSGGAPSPAPTIAPSSRRSPAPAETRAATLVVASWPATAPEFFAELLRRVAAGSEPELTPVADLLEAAAAVVASAAAEVASTRLRDIEQTARAQVGRGLAWSSLSTYVEPDADATALRAAYLDFDRVGEYTGKPGTKTLRREGDATFGKTDAVRRMLAMEFGARWTFRAKSLDRGRARIIVTSLVAADDTAHMLATRGMMIAFPTSDGVVVTEASSSVVDFQVPSILKGTAESMARKEALARIHGMRTHWREYVK